MNYIRLYEFIFNRVKDPVESLDLLLQLEIPPADPGTFLAAHIDGETKVVARFVGGGGGGAPQSSTFLRMNWGLNLLIFVDRSFC